MAEAKESDSIQVLTQNDIFNPMMKYLKEDGQPGLPVGFKTFGEFYSHKQGGVTDWTGFPSSGKTYFALEILMGLSERYGKRHGLYVPDIGSNNEIIEQLVKMRTGKDFSNKYQNKITEKELSLALPWIMHHFVLFKKKDFKKGITPIAFWEKICLFNDDSMNGPSGKLDTGLADSWKNFKHIYQSREDSYLDEILSIRNEMAEEYQKHFHTIAHAVKTEMAASVEKGGTGKRRIPTAWDIKGGGSWNANGKNIITVDRADKNSNFVDLYINKVKPSTVGKEGALIGRIQLDLRKGRYFENINFGHHYSYDWEKLPVQEEMDFDPSPIQESFDFDRPSNIVHPPSGLLNDLEEEYPF